MYQMYIEVLYYITIHFNTYFVTNKFCNVDIMLMILFQLISISARTCVDCLNYHISLSLLVLFSGNFICTIHIVSFGFNFASFFSPLSLWTPVQNGWWNVPRIHQKYVLMCSHVMNQLLHLISIKKTRYMHIFLFWSNVYDVRKLENKSTW